jgi:chromosome transmission fidelity protein 18
VFSSNEWELAPYLSSPILAFHHLFASPTRAQFQAAAAGPKYENETEADAAHPFTGPNASWAAHEAQKVNAEHLKSLQASLSLPLTRMFSCPADVAVDLQPYLLRMLSPDINPVIIAGSGKEKGASVASVRKASEQTLLKRSLNAMGASGVRFDRMKVSQDNASGGPAWGSQQFIYRMEPPVDLLCTFDTGGKALTAAIGDNTNKSTRYAVRQVLEQEWRKEESRLAEETRAARMGGTAPTATKRSNTSAEHEDDDNDTFIQSKKVARDFFGRPIVQAAPAAGSEAEEKKRKMQQRQKTDQGPTVRIAYNEGYSNAVRKPLTMAEFLKDL